MLFDADHVTFTAVVLTALTTTHDTASGIIKAAHMHTDHVFYWQRSLTGATHAQEIAPNKMQLYLAQ